MCEKKPYQVFPDTKKVDEFVLKLNKAKRPLLVSGRGARASKSSIEEFLSKTGVLYIDTQDSRGLISPEHTSNVFAARSKVMEEADLIILVGRKLDYQLAYGSPAIFSKATFVRISSNPH